MADTTPKLNNSFDLASGKLELTKQFAGLVKEELHKSAIMELTLKNVVVKAGQLVFYKAGADERLDVPFSKVEYNDTSNIYEEISIPMLLEYSTHEIRLSKIEWEQLFTNPDAQALKVKAQKVAKVLARIIMSLWFTDTITDNTGNVLKLGDGAIPTVKWEFKTVFAKNTREEIAEEFDGFVADFIEQTEKIRNIGFKDPKTGKNSTDPYRTGVEVNNSIYKIYTDQAFKTRYQVWASHFNVVNTLLENGSYGSIEGYALVEDIFLPFVKQNIGADFFAKHKYNQDKKELKTTDTETVISFMFLKPERLIKGNVFDFMWNESIPKSDGGQVVGWTGKAGAGTVFPDELFAYEITVTEGETGGGEGGETTPKLAPKDQAFIDVLTSLTAEVKELKTTKTTK